MAEKKDDKQTESSVTFKHVTDGREITLRGNATNQIAEYEAHPNWKRSK